MYKDPGLTKITLGKQGLEQGNNKETTSLDKVESKRRWAFSRYGLGSHIAAFSDLVGLHLRAVVEASLRCPAGIVQVVQGSCGRYAEMGAVPTIWVPLFHPKMYDAM